VTVPRIVRGDVFRRWIVTGFARPTEKIGATVRSISRRRDRTRSASITAASAAVASSA
jgi:hypothetical protein